MAPEEVILHQDSLVDLLRYVPLWTLAWAALGLSALWWERRSDRRTSAWALIGVVLVVIGSMTAFMQLAERAASGGGGREFGPYRLVYFLWAAALLCGLLSLPGILRGRREGAVLTTCAIAMPLCWGGIVSLMFWHPPVPGEYGSVDLTTCWSASPHIPDPDEPRRPILRMARWEGRLSLTWVAPGVPPREITSKELAPLVQDLVPVFRLAADRDLPFEQIAEVLDAARATGAGVLAVVRIPVSWPSFGFMSLQLGSQAGAHHARLTRDQSGPVIELDGLRTRALAVEQLRHKEIGDTQECDLVVEPGFSLEDVLHTMDELYGAGASVVLLDIER